MLRYNFAGFPPWCRTVTITNSESVLNVDGHDADERETKAATNKARKAPPRRTTFKCGSCDYKCRNTWHLKRHMKIHTASKTEPDGEGNRTAGAATSKPRKAPPRRTTFKCDLCDYTCQNTWHLKRHMKIHGASGGELKVRGPDAEEPQPTDTSSVVTDVPQRIPPRRKTYTCDLCDYTCQNTWHLKRHMKIHAPSTKEKKIYNCNLCDYKTLRPDHLEGHVKSHHQEFACEECGQKFIRAGDLKVHMRIHTGEKPYMCSVCDYKCAQAGNFKAHMRTHTGEKPHSCNFCDYKTSIPGKLKVHLRIHTGEKPYSCSACDFKTSHSHHLKRHMVTHTGECPFTCEYCDYKCTRRYTLKAHLRKVHDR